MMLPLRRLIRGISPTESQPEMREKHETHLYQALYQGPMLPRRTDHSVERHHQGDFMSTVVIDDGSNVAVGIDEDNDIPPKINLFEKFEKLDNGDAQVMYDKEVFLHRGSNSSITNTRDNEAEYEEMKNLDDSVDMRDHDVDFREMTGMNAIRNSEEVGHVGACNVRYEVRIFRDDDSHSYIS